MVVLILCELMINDDWTPTRGRFLLPDSMPLAMCCSLVSRFPEHLPRGSCGRTSFFALRVQRVSVGSGGGGGGGGGGGRGGGSAVPRTHPRTGTRMPTPSPSSSHTKARFHTPA
jgi:hypothetical protein